MFKRKENFISESDGVLVSNSIIGLVVEFIVAIDEARVRFTDDALTFSIFYYLPG